MLFLFAATLCANACLLFLIQPMVSRMILPLMGGAPAVWTTCLLFFQGVLLAGYLYSHLLTTRLSFRKQVLVHSFVLLGSALCLPLEVSSGALDGIYSLLGRLALTAGLPFFALSTTAPLLQKWFSNTDHESSKDPYFLYSASNLGSLVGVLGYPALFEPLLRLGTQTRVWAFGYALLAMLLAASAFLAKRQRAAVAEKATGVVTRQDRVRWIALALVPSSLLVGVTAHLTTDVAPIPLFWMVPLAVYLVTFILAFGKYAAKARELSLPLALFSMLGLFFSMVADVSVPMWLLVVSHLTAFFVGAMACHGELALRRPEPAHLTEYYLWISVGGALGSAFNVLVAPLIFSQFVEYPLALLAVCLLVPTPPQKRALVASDFAASFSAAIIALVCVHTVPVFGDFFSGDEVRGIASGNDFGGALGWLPMMLVMAVVPFLFCRLSEKRPASFRIAILLLALVSVANGFATTQPLHRERSFFGVLSIYDDGEDVHELRHGRTIHGAQDFEDRAEPLTYYHSESPIAQVFSVLKKKGDSRPAAVIGLGTGTLAAYAVPGQEMVFYEIDPGVVRVATDARYFTYLPDATKRGVDLRFEVGDARLKMARAADGKFGLIVVDAFSSDAIPMHLLTKEALEIYLSKLAPGGVLAFHVSNKYVDLKPPLASLAAALQITALHGSDDDDWEENDPRSGSDWMVFSRSPGFFRELAAGPGSWDLVSPENALPWHDDFYNLVSFLRWSDEPK